MNEESRDLDNLAGLEAGQLALVTEHPERGLLADEVHARPPMRLNAPAKVSHLVMLSGEDAAPDERSHLALLCESFDVSVPDHAARQFFADFGTFKLRWERHTEFAAWTFVRESAIAAATFDQPFADLPLGHVPAEWLIPRVVNNDPFDGPRWFSG